MERARHGEAVQVDPIKPTLKAPGTNLLTLKCDEPPSTFAFKSNLRRYIKVARFVNQMLLRPSLHYEQAEKKLYLMFAFHGVDDDDSATRVGWMASVDGGRHWGTAKQNIGLTSGPTKGPWLAGGAWQMLLAIATSSNAFIYNPRVLR